MKTRIVNVVLGLAAICLLASGIEAQQRQFLISGRAVDHHGVPVPNVIATLYSPPCSGCIDNVVPANRAVADGVFFVDSTGGPRDRFTLYLEEIPAPDFWSPLGGPPFQDLAHLPEFRGLRIRPPRHSDRVDLGNVVVRVRFGKVVLQVPEKWKELAPEASALRLHLRDRTGAVIYNGEIPTMIASAKSESVKLALTPGRWTLQLSLRNGQQIFRSPIKSVTVRLNSCAAVSFDRSTRTKPC
jgi:hypothetical protein